MGTTVLNTLLPISQSASFWMSLMHCRFVTHLSGKNKGEVHKLRQEGAYKSVIFVVVLRKCFTGPSAAQMCMKLSRLAAQQLLPLTSDKKCTDIAPREMLARHMAHATTCTMRQRSRCM